MLMINMIIISALLIASFSVIFFITWQNESQFTRQRLDRSIEEASGQKGKNGLGNRSGGANPGNDSSPPPMPSGETSKGRGQGNMNDAPASSLAPDAGNGPADDSGPAAKNGGNNPFSPSFTVTVDNNMEITQVKSMFTLSDEDYKNQIPDIIKSADKYGSASFSNSHWAYEYKKTDSGYIIVFIEHSTERTMLINLIWILSCVLIITLIITYLISLVSANRSIKPIEESYNKQKQFVADASHELKTPLATIGTNVEVLESHPEETIGAESKWLGYIKDEVTRMTKLTNDLLYLARTDYDSSNMIFERVSLSDAAESVILTMEAVIFEKNIDMTYNIMPDIYVMSGAEQLKQLIMILIDNAVKYTPEKGKISVKLHTDSKDMFALLAVKNTGSGISKDDMEHIFDRFYRADKSRARDSGGYGLGLAIAQAIAKASKGSVTVDSKLDEYTEFTVHLPLAKD